MNWFSFCKYIVVHKKQNLHNTDIKQNAQIRFCYIYIRFNSANQLNMYELSRFTAIYQFIHTAAVYMFMLLYGMQCGTSSRVQHCICIQRKIFVGRITIQVVQKAR